MVGKKKKKNKFPITILKTLEYHNLSQLTLLHKRGPLSHHTTSWWTLTWDTSQGTGILLLQHLAVTGMSPTMLKWASEHPLQCQKYFKRQRAHCKHSHQKDSDLPEGWCRHTNNITFQPHWFTIISMAKLKRLVPSPSKTGREETKRAPFYVSLSYVLMWATRRKVLLSESVLIKAQRSLYDPTPKQPWGCYQKIQISVKTKRTWKWQPQQSTIYHFLRRGTSQKDTSQITGGTLHNC